MRWTRARRLAQAALCSVTLGGLPLGTLSGQARSGPHPVTLRLPVADTGVFSPLALPTANRIRRANGSPGAEYWQQRADYRIAGVLDTALKALDGDVTIRYTNNSPDTLRFLWLQLDQNLFSPGSTGSLLADAGSRFGGARFKGGFTLHVMEQVRPAPRHATDRVVGPPAPTALTWRRDDTMLFVELAEPLPPRTSTQLHVTYDFAVPEHGADRMGRLGSLYEIAQWYPRMAVYDDVRGWNTDQYLGQGEFYLEYGDIDYAVTVPAGFIVAGTGVLANPQEVLTPSIRSRLATARQSDTTVHIVTAAELASGAARPMRSGTLTWRFHAANVRDAAWTASPEYLWDASGWHGVTANAYYRAAAESIWKDAAKMSRYSIQEYSTRWFAYPYPQISAVEGPVSGMEYPMVAMESDWPTPQALYNVVTHEIGHMWYPMIVGSDERRYAWMDEGFNTFIKTFSEQDYWTRNDDSVRRGEIGFVVGNDQGDSAQPIMTAANRYRTGANLGALAYVKPSIMLLTLRNKVLGPEVFDAAFREYTRRWAFKHPKPADFFRSIEDVAGRDLSWYWREWFYTTDALDQSVDTVAQNVDSAGRRQTVVTPGNRGPAVMPVELELTYADGSRDLLRFPLEIWYRGNTYAAHVDTDKTIVRARVNPDGMFPDVNPGNNEWSATGAVP